MKFISIIGMLGELDNVVNVCGKSEIFQPDDVFSFYSNTENFVQVPEDNFYSIPLKKLKDTINLCGVQTKKVDIKNFEVSREQINEYIDYISEKLGKIVLEKKELNLKLESYSNEIKTISHFTGMNVNLDDLLSCEFVKVRFGKLPKESYDKLSNYDEDSHIVFFPCTEDEAFYWGIYFAPLDDFKEIDRIFSSLYFESLDVPSFNGTAEMRIEELKKLSEEVKNEIGILDNKIKSFWNVQYEQCMRFYSKLEELSIYESIKRYVVKYNDCFILVGWITADDEREFCRNLSKINSIEYSMETGKNVLSHSPPVKLKNKKLFKPFEFFVGTYGLPSYNETDPTVFVAITYTILFGIMFADLGQGILVSVIGYFMWKLKNMKLGKIMISCGISSAIFGTFFGSVFGFEHALDSMYSKVFGLKEKPIEVMESSSTNMIIYSAVGIGICLLILAMIINIYSSLRRKNYENAIFGSNGVCGLIFYLSVIFMLLDSMMLHTGIVNIFFIIVFLILPIILIFFKEILGKLIMRSPNWVPESWGDYILQNFFEMFEVILSYLTNTMSFLRVGAFVLVHAGMMMVVFTIANMCGPVGYIIAVIIGNIFVAALEALLAGIQVLRLEFYELFSRFFEAQGRPFNPVIIEKQ